jgi:glutamate synthase (NADPH/NADH) small chain
MLKNMGVKFRLGVRVGKDVLLDDVAQQFDAIYLAIGAQKARTLDIPGSDLNGIYQALTFLVQKNSYLQLDIPQIDVVGKKVAVLGGGDTAMDCLRTAIRCGAKEAVCVYRRDFENMPGSRAEYKNAIEEGAKFLFLTNPVEILGNSNGSVRAVKCIKMKLGEPDKRADANQSQFQTQSLKFQLM